MFLTLFHIYATVMYWLRTRQLQRKLSDTLGAQNALILIGGGSSSPTSTKSETEAPLITTGRSLVGLIFKQKSRLGFTVTPKQTLNLAHFAAFPTNRRHFPIRLTTTEGVATISKTQRLKNGVVTENLDSNVICLLLTTRLTDHYKYDRYNDSSSRIIEIERHSQLLGWRVTSTNFDVCVRTSLEWLAKLTQRFLEQHHLNINHELELVRIETVDVEGIASSIRYTKTYLTDDELLEYGWTAQKWRNFVQDLRDLYGKLHETPQIKIVNGTPKSGSECGEPPPVVSTAENPVLSACATSLQTAPSVDCGVEKKCDKLTVHDGSQRQRHRKTSEKHTRKVLKKKRSTPSLVRKYAVDGIVQAKPTNILVYADSQRVKENVKKLLKSTLQKDTYAIYDLPLKTSMWDTTTALVVVCGSVPPDVTSHLIRFLLNGGQLLCICSDLMYSVLHTFTTAEVREHELVRFSYAKWQNIQLMHHIFCYQASPIRKQFSHGDSSEKKPALSVRNVVLRYSGTDYDVCVKVLGTEDTWHTPSLLHAQVDGAAATSDTKSSINPGDGNERKTSGGRAIFSQVHLEIDPDADYLETEHYDALKGSDVARLAIFRDILTSQFELETNELDESQLVEFSDVYKEGYFLGKFEEKIVFLENFNHQLVCEGNFKVKFYANSDESGDRERAPSETFLPVHIHSCPANFSTVDYFENLTTCHVGRLVIYADVITSTQRLLSGTLRHGLAVIAAQQTQAVGRANNVWLSPPGSACFSLQLHVPLASPLGRHLPIIQHMVAAGIVRAIKLQPGFEYLDVGIKWPNDLYVNHSTKVGGLIVTSMLNAQIAIVNIGCGLNLSNKNPTLSLNSLQTNEELRIGHEKYFAIVFNEIERLYEQIQNSDVHALYDLYYEHWLHNDCDVRITEGNSEKFARIVGIDEWGYLVVRLADSGATVSVQPDGNSFDMMRGLIAPKIF